MKDTAQHLIARFENMRGARAVWESTWQDILDYFLPRRAPVIGTEVGGTKRGTKIYDSEPVRSLVKLAATLNSMLTNQASQWFAVECTDEALNERRDVKQYLDGVNDILKRQIDNSNFGTESHELYIDMPSICTAVMFVEPSALPGRSLHFSTRHIKECYIADDAQGYVDTIFRLIDTMTARQVKKRFAPVGGSIPEEIEQAIADDHPEKTFELLHCVYPREEFDPERIDRLNMPYASAWIHPASQKLIHESGYHEFPAAVVRWAKSSGEIYGRGPALDALADAKSLQKMGRTLLRVGEKVADPPLQAPYEGFLGKYKLLPGAINYYDPASKNRIEPINIGANFPVTLQMIQDRRDMIRETMFVNQLQIIDQKAMTAEEVRARMEENVRILGPVFSRWQVEYLDVIVGRTYMICSRAGLLPPAPPVLQGRELRVRYLSPLAKSLQFHEVQSITRTVQTAVAWARETGRVDLLDNIDLDAAVRMVAELDGAPQKVLRDPRLRDMLRQARAEQQRLADQAALAKDQAVALEKTAGAAAQMRAANA